MANAEEQYLDELFGDSSSTPDAPPADTTAGWNSVAPPSFVGTPGTPGTGGISNGLTNALSGISLSGPAQNLINTFITPAVTGLTDGLKGAAAAIPGLGAGAAVAATAALGSSTASTSIWSDLFLRGVVIITGFIFVAEGLSMFKGNGSIVVNVAKRALK